MKRFLQRLRQRRVGVDVADQFLDGQIPLGQGELRQRLGDVGADQVRAEQLPVRAIGDDLGEPGRIAVAVGFSVGAEGELGHRDVAITRSGISAGLGFSQAETGDLGLAERHARHHRVVGHPQRWCTRNGFGGDDALGLRPHGRASAWR